MTREVRRAGDLLVLVGGLLVCGCSRGVEAPPSDAVVDAGDATPLRDTAAETTIDADAGIPECNGGVASGDLCASEGQVCLVLDNCGLSVDSRGLRLVCKYAEPDVKNLRWVTVESWPCPADSG